MAPPNSKNNRDVAPSSDTQSFTGTTVSSYDGDTESSFWSGSDSGRSTPSRRSRLDSYLSTASTDSRRSPRRRRNLSSGTETSRSLSSRPSGSTKSILKTKKKTTTSSSIPRHRSLSKSGQQRSRSLKRRSLSKSSRRSPKKEMRPVGKFEMIKNPVILRGFVTEYAQDPDFEAFSLSVDGIPFVALSLMNADEDLRRRIHKVQPPTPMKKHTPGVNSPRKRPSLPSSLNSKCVRFTDESCSPKKARKSGSTEDDIRELGETVSDAMIETDRKYNNLWSDRAESK